MLGSPSCSGISSHSSTRYNSPHNARHGDARNMGLQPRRPTPRGPRCGASAAAAAQLALPFSLLLLLLSTSAAPTSTAANSTATDANATAAAAATDAP